MTLATLFTINPFSSGYGQGGNIKFSWLTNTAWGEFVPLNTTKSDFAIRVLTRYPLSFTAYSQILRSHLQWLLNFLHVRMEDVALVPCEWNMTKNYKTQPLLSMLFSVAWYQDLSHRYVVLAKQYLNIKFGCTANNIIHFIYDNFIYDK